jgi:menaquinone-dependent protoporphyrinogen oxidase
MRKISRRKFMKDSVTMAGGMIGTMTIGSGAIAPKTALTATKNFGEWNCSPQIQNGRTILVGYASHCGSTMGVAQKIAHILCRQGESVIVRPVNLIRDLSDYKAVIIGSAIHRSQWLPEAEDFVESFQKPLSRMPVAYFLTCLALCRNNDESRRESRAFLDPVLEKVPAVRPLDIGLFAGVLDYSKLSFIMRMIMKRKMKEKGVAEGDYRDWRAIEAWAGNMRTKLV